MALPMYEAMGFRTIVRYVTFSQPAPDHAKFAQPQEGGEFAPTASPIGHETPVPPRPQ